MKGRRHGVPPSPLLLTSPLTRQPPTRDHDKHPPPAPPKAVYVPAQPTRGRSYSTSSLASSASFRAAGPTTSSPVEERVRLEMFRVGRETGEHAAVGLQKPAEGRVLVRAGQGGF